MLPLPFFTGREWAKRLAARCFSAARCAFSLSARVRPCLTAPLGRLLSLFSALLAFAAEAGCGYAWLLLGWFFSEQPSAFRCSTEVPTVEECFKKAELYYKKAIEAGENAARTLLGKLYIFGCGSARVYSENRVEEGLEQLELAAEGGDASAAELLAAVYGNDVYDESPFDVQWMLEMGVLKPEFLVEGEDGELYVAPEGLGLVNLESVENEELALYWQKRAEALGRASTES